MSKKQKKGDKNFKIPKSILFTAKILQFLNPKWATLFAVKLFTTPLKFKIPAREHEMEHNSVQEDLFIPAIGLKIRTYIYGNNNPRVLLIHGWSGRGTQLVKFADELIKNNFQTVSFDAPAHGKSEGKTAIMNNFIASVSEIDKKYGPFDFAICHSLGGMTLINSIKFGLHIQKGVIVGSGNSIQRILNNFVDKLGLPKSQSINMKDFFEKKYQMEMESFSTYRAAQSVDTPILIIHDEVDEDIPVEEAIEIHENLKNSKLLITKGLGHRKILGDKTVISQSIHFLLGRN